jgi:hypothetical protein
MIGKIIRKHKAILGKEWEDSTSTFISRKGYNSPEEKISC